jgi:hypothetical protein
MLLAMAFVGVYWIIRRKAMPRVRLTHWVVGFVPVVLMLGFSSWLLHHNTGRRGLLSENGSFNLVFGRCHNEKIQSMPDGEGHGKVHFRPPPYLQLNNTQRKREAEGLEPAIKLDPAISDTFEYKGYIGDKAQHMEYIRECWRRTGLRKQLSYSWTNVILLWRHNIPWPDSGRAQWRTVSRWWTVQHRALFAIPALIGLISLVMRRRFIKQAMVALQLAGLLLLASIFFGGIRHRTPYDYLIIFLALETYAFAGLWLGKLALQRLGRWSAARKGGSSGQNSSSS